MEFPNLIFQFRRIIQKSSSYAEFEDLLNSLPALPTYAYFRDYIFYTNADPSDLICKIVEDSLEFNIQVENEQISSFSLTDFTTQEILTFLVVLPISSCENLFRLFTIADYDLSNKIKSIILSHLYPNGLLTFFKQDEIYFSLKKLENQLLPARSITVTESILKGKDKDPNGNTYVHTERVWKKQTIKEAFEEAFERHEWFSSIKFNIMNNRKGRNFQAKISECRINKFGEVYYSGLQKNINKNLVLVLADFVYERLAKFQNRGIRERGYIPGKPLEILFEYEKFGQVEEIRRFGKTLNEYPDSSIAVFHGNPYYHASIADFADGSSFDIWILSSNRIIIKPQLRATPQALERLISYISSEYGEGKINEYSG
jgi:hypothetical protein